jgi:acetyl esterase/lipase
MVKYFYALIVLSLSLAGCQKQVDDAVKPVEALLYKELKNESYGTDPAQKADVYLPANRTTTATKVAILLHGGAWSSGDKADLNQFIGTVQQKYPELAIVNRLASPSNYHPAQVNDIQILLDYLGGKSSTWGISNNYAIGGVSAGAHLALLYTYKFDVAKKIKVVLSVVGPTYFLDPYYVNNPLYQPIVTNFIGKPLNDSASYRDASPAWVVTASAPPTYMAYGGLDPLVPVANPVLLDQKLTTLNVPHHYDFFPTEGHEFTIANYDTVARKMVAFLKQYQ